MSFAAFAMPVMSRELLSASMDSTSRCRNWLKMITVFWSARWLLVLSNSAMSACKEVWRTLGGDRFGGRVLRVSRHLLPLSPVSQCRRVHNMCALDNLLHSTRMDLGQAAHVR